MYGRRYSCTGTMTSTAVRVRPYRFSVVLSAAGESVQNTVQNSQGQGHGMQKGHTVAIINSIILKYSCTCEHVQLYLVYY